MYLFKELLDSKAVRWCCPQTTEVCAYSVMVLGRSSSWDVIQLVSDKQQKSAPLKEAFRDALNNKAQPAEYYTSWAPYVQDQTHSTQFRVFQYIGNTHPEGDKDGKGMRSYEYAMLN